MYICIHTSIYIYVCIYTYFFSLSYFVSTSSGSLHPTVENHAARCRTMAPSVPHRPNHKCFNFPICLGAEAQLRVQGHRTRSALCSSCLQKPLCRHPFCQNNTAHDGASSPSHGLCSLHMDQQHVAGTLHAVSFSLSSFRKNVLELEWMLYKHLDPFKDHPKTPGAILGFSADARV